MIQILERLIVDAYAHSRGFIRKNRFVRVDLSCLLLEKKSQDESFAYPHLARFVDNLDAASKRATIWYYIQLIRIRTNIILTIRIRNYN